MWTKHDIPDQTGKTIIVTGANTGIGYETALALHEAGADVIAASRNLEKTEQAVSGMRAFSKGNGVLDAMELDLANLKAVREFSEAFKDKYTKLDILINNAGVMLPPLALTADGFELQFGVNFLGHFALTGYVYPLLVQAAGTRIITLSSGAATQAECIDFNNLRLEKPYDAQLAYAVSKLADIHFTRELNRRLEALHSPVISAAAHPGVVRTDLQRHIPAETLEQAFAQFSEVMEPWQGALPSLFAATDPSVYGGALYGPDGDREFAGYPALSGHHTAAMNNEAEAEKLWVFAEEVTGIEFPF